MGRGGGAQGDFGTRAEVVEQARLRAVQPRQRRGTQDARGLRIQRMSSDGLCLLLAQYPHLVAEPPAYLNIFQRFGFGALTINAPALGFPSFPAVNSMCA